MRTRIMNQLQALAMNEGQRRKKKLWSAAGRAQLEKLPLAPWASRRRKDLLELLDRMNLSIEELTAAIEREARKWPEALRLMTHPGVGPLTALAFVLIIGTVERFQRFLLGEAAQAATRCDADWRRRYLHLALRRQRNIAKVAMARRLGVRLYWMWRKGWEYSDWIKFGSHAGQLGIGNGVQ
jgi:transposase